MGLFSNKVKTYVSSAVFNLAGDPDLQPKVMRTLLLGSVLSGSKDSIASTISGSLLTGGGFQQRMFFNWCKTHYDLGMPKAVVSGTNRILTSQIQSALRTALGVTAGQNLEIFAATIDDADIDYWARIWILTNHPTSKEYEWSADWDDLSNEIVIDRTVLHPTSPIHRMAAPAHLLWGMDRSVGLRKLLYCTYRIHSAPDAQGKVTLGPTQLFTYCMGTGTLAFDALARSSNNLTEFFPVLPLRIDNKSITHSSLTDVYEAVVPAYRKLTGQKIGPLLDQIEDNEDIANIDYCFLVQGVSLNTKDNEARRYLYAFFESLMDVQKTSKAEFEDYRDWRAGVISGRIRSDRWLAANSDLNQKYTKPDNRSSPIVGGTYTLPEGIAPPAASELRLHVTEIPDFDYRLQWVYVAESQHKGNGKTFDGAITRGKMKRGDYWFHAAPDITLPYVRRTRDERDSYPSEIYTQSVYKRLWLFYQHSAYAYSRLEIVDPLHVNYVYKGHTVRITGSEALADSKTSGFLVPLHYPTVRKIGLLGSTQLAGQSANLVFNSYQNVVVKWYQRGFWKFFISIVIAVVSVFVAPAGAALAGSGILGSNLAIGVAMGITSATLAAVAGAIANSIAAMIVTSLIQKASVSLFGEKFGQLIGTALSFISMTYAKAYVDTGSFNVDWGSLMRIDNLMDMTKAVSTAYGVWTNVNLANIAEDMKQLGLDYQSKMDEIDQKSKALFGMTSGEIDPMMFTNAFKHSFEGADKFVERTTMTGDELAELSQVMVSEFASISLELSLA